MPPLATDALVLRTYAMGETSAVVVLLTRERGKLRAVAKGARGPRPRYRSALEPLSEVRVELYGRQGTDLYRLGDCDLLRSAFHATSRGLDAALAVPYCAELLDALSPEGEVDDNVYRLGRAVVAGAAAGQDVPALLRYLEAWLLRLAGLYPQLDRCAGCGNALYPAERRYSAPAHGFVCGCVASGGPVLPAAAVAFLEDAWRRPPHDVAQEPRPDAAGLEDFHRMLIERHLERSLRSDKVLHDVARGAAGR
jgi:DNA repair protein RecO (recombination protein O)